MRSIGRMSNNSVSSRHSSLQKIKTEENQRIQKGQNYGRAANEANTKIVSSSLSPSQRRKIQLRLEKELFQIQKNDQIAYISPKKTVPQERTVLPALKNIKYESPKKPQISFESLKIVYTAGEKRKYFEDTQIQEQLQMLDKLTSF